MIIGEIKTTGLEAMALLPLKLNLAVKAALEQAGSDLADAIQEQIENSPATGRVYGSRKGFGTHQAAAPGESIHEDTAGTQDAIIVNTSELEAGTVSVGWTGARAKEMMAQEFGSASGRVPPHPTIVPATAKALPGIAAMIVAEIEAAIK